MPLDLVQVRELTVGGVFRHANTWPLELELVVQGKVGVDRLVTSRHGLDGVEAALRSSGGGHIKAVVHPTAVSAVVARRPQQRATPPVG